MDRITYTTALVPKVTCFDAIRQIEGSSSAWFHTLAFTWGSDAASLYGRVTYATEEHKLGSILIIKAYNKAKEEKDLSSAIVAYHIEIDHLRKKYHPFLNASISSMIQIQAEALFIGFAQKIAPLRQEELNAFADQFQRNGIAIESLTRVYIQDPICQKATLRHLETLQKRLIELEKKPAEALQNHTIALIKEKSDKVTKCAADYFDAERALKTLEQDLLDKETISEEEETNYSALSGRLEILSQLLMQAVSDYDTSVSYTSFINRYVSLIQYHLPEINKLKDEFDTYQRPFMNQPNNPIAQITLPSRLDAQEAVKRLPPLRTLNDLIGNLHQTLKDRNVILAARIVHETGQYASSNPAHANLQVTLIEKFKEKFNKEDYTLDDLFATLAKAQEEPLDIMEQVLSDIIK